MRRILTLAAILMMLPATASVEADGEARSLDYWGANGELTRWCPEGGHTYLPDGAPEDHDGPAEWVGSGRPACLPGDTLFGTEGHHAIGGGAFCIRPESMYTTEEPPYPADCDDHSGHAFTVTADDRVGPAPLYVHMNTNQEEPVWETGCGSVSGTIPAVLHRPWEGDDYAWLWVTIDAVRVDPYDLEVCIGSAGALHAVY